MSVYGDRRANPEIRSTDEPKPMAHDYFALTKLEAENIIKESGIPYTIFRYAPICGNTRYFFSKTVLNSFFYLRSLKLVCRYESFFLLFWIGSKN